jgi:Big-like domain-containing protein
MKIPFSYAVLLVCMWVPAVWADGVPQPLNDVAGQAVAQTAITTESAPVPIPATLAPATVPDMDKAVLPAPAAAGDGFSPRLVMVGKKPPVSGINIDEPYVMALDGIVYVTATSTFSIKAVGGVSGVAKSEYRLDSGQWKDYEPFTIAAEGAHLIEYRSIDKAGNVESIRIVPVVVDLTPPATTLSVDGENRAAGSPVFITRTSTIILTATDNHVGGAVTEYRLDRGPWRTYTPFTVSAREGHTIGFRSRDILGNLEEEKTVTIGSHKSPPKTAISVGEPKYAAATGTLYVSGRTPFTLAVIESVSGAARTEYRIDDGPWTGYSPFTIDREGKHQISFRSIDKAGNMESAQRLSVAIDATPPETTLFNAGEELAAGGSLASNKKLGFTLRAVDELTQVKGTEYRVNDGPWTASDSFSLVDEGKYLLEYRSVDRLGNVEASRSFTAIVDKTPPLSEIAIGFPKREAGGVTYINSSTKLVPKAADNLSGVAKVEYWIAGKGDGRDSAPFNILTKGKYRIDYQGIDKAGNREPVKSINVVVDNTLPVVKTADGKPPDEESGGRKQKIRVEENAAAVAPEKGEESTADGASGRADYFARFKDSAGTQPARAAAAAVPAPAPVAAVPAPAVAVAQPATEGTAEKTQAKLQLPGGNSSEGGAVADVVLKKGEEAVSFDRTPSDRVKLDKLASGQKTTVTAAGETSPAATYPRSAASGEEKEKTSFFDYFTFGIVNIAIVIGVMLL